MNHINIHAYRKYFKSSCICFKHIIYCDTQYLLQDELVSRLDKKLEVLRGEQVVVDDECRMNDELGENVEVYINRVARPQEVSKFRLHVEEVGKITSLLLSLSGRLARAENALMGMTEDHPERVSIKSNDSFAQP